MAEYLTKNGIEYKRLYCDNEGIPYRWSNLYEQNRTVEDYEMNWKKYFFNLINIFLPCFLEFSI